MSAVVIDHSISIRCVSALEAQRVAEELVRRYPQDAVTIDGATVWVALTNITTTTENMGDKGGAGWL